MDKKIKKIYSGDFLMIFSFICFMWIMLTVTRSNIKLLTEDASVIMFMNGLWILILGFGTMALMAVFIHLKSHKERIYTEDLENGERYK